MKAQQIQPLHPDCETCSSREYSVLADLGLPQLNILSSSKSCRRYQRGEMILDAGERPAGLFCVHIGKAKVYKTGSDGREQIIRLVGPGDILGYRALLSGTPYSSNASALEDTQVCSIPRSEFFALLTHGSDFSMRVMALLSNELRVAEEKLVEIAQKTVRERLAETLLLLHEKYGVTADGSTLDVKLTREELANLVGTVTESAIRNLSELRREGIIAMNGSKLSILNHDALVTAANIDD